MPEPSDAAIIRDYGAAESCEMRRRCPVSLPPEEWRFLLMVAMGKSIRHAAMEALGWNERSATEHGYLILRRPRLKEAMEWIRAEIAEAVAMSSAELAQWLVGIIRATPNELDLDSSFVQGWDVTETEKQTKTTVKMVSKIDAAKLLAAMAGWTKPESHKISMHFHNLLDQQDLGDLLARSGLKAAAGKVLDEA